MPVTVRDRHLDQGTMIWDAASMFLSSPLARGKGHPPAYASLAQRAAKALRKEIGEGDVTFGKTNRAFVRTGNDPYYITINYRLSNSIAGTSIMLVHEALHLVKHVHTVDEELHARRLQVMYFRNLLQTRWQFTTRSGQRDWSTQLRRNDPVDKSLQLTDMERLDARNQLVDYVLRINTYARSINAGWVKQNLPYWGGITNRWPETRGLYVARLAKPAGVENARVVKQILQSLLELNKFQSSPAYQSYQLTANALNNFAVFAAGGLGHSAEDGWKVVRAAIKPLLSDANERQEFETIERRLSPLGNPIYIVTPPGVPQL